VLHDEPGFSEIFIPHLLARTIRVEEDLVDQLFDSSEKRLARLLFLLANFGKEGRPEPIIAKISQERLAEMIGTTRTRELLHEQISGVWASLITTAAAWKFTAPF
jgi:CRP/FNR family transcriptional regulator, cyclic AMP receptor protein